jgi:hypothetical protein
MKGIRLILLMILTGFFLTSFHNFSPVKGSRVISIEKAIRIGYIQATIQGNGGSMGNCIQITMKNLTKKDTTILVEAGRRLLSNDTSKQDILITKEQQIALNGGQEITINVYGFCCEMTNSAPGLKNIYSVGYMTDTPMVALAKFLNEQDFPIDASQHAVWAISNNLSVAAIYDGDFESIKELRQFVAMLEGVPVPWYSIAYKQDTVRLFSGIHESLHGSFSYHISNVSIVSLMVYNSEGTLIDGIFINRPALSGDFNYPFTLDVKGYTKGKYYLRLFSGKQQIKEKIFVL